jgi:manganese oxidase
MVPILTDALWKRLRELMANEVSRRSFVSWLAGFASLPLLGAGRKAAAAMVSEPAGEVGDAGYPAVVTPGIKTLSYEVVAGVKVFRLVAERLIVKFPDGSDPHMMKKRPIHVWGYNGSMIGPTIEVREGDTVRIIFQNNLPEPTTVHWHGLELPIGMDGVPGFSQDPVPPGGSFTYEFPIEQPAGTFFYHSHVMGAKQVGLGLMGLFIIHPKSPSRDYIVQRDYAFMLQVWKINPGSPIPDILEMSNFNYFTMNGIPGPDIPPMSARLGEKVRIRVVNLSMLSHPVHLHGHQFKITDWGGGFLPTHQQITANTINISSAEARTLEFTAQRPGKWAFHCHFLHHTMNDMDRLALPGAPSHEGMNHDMGGMHTWIEIS